MARVGSEKKEFGVVRPFRLELEGEGGGDGESVVRAIVMLAGRLGMG